MKSVIGTVAATVALPLLFNLVMINSNMEHVSGLAQEEYAKSSQLYVKFNKELANDPEFVEETLPHLDYKIFDPIKYYTSVRQEIDDHPMSPLVRVLPGTKDYLESFQKIDELNKENPYILDKYYTQHLVQHFCEYQLPDLAPDFNPTPNRSLPELLTKHPENIEPVLEYCDNGAIEHKDELTEAVRKAGGFAGSVES